MSGDTVINLDFDKLPGGQQSIGGLVLGNLTGEEWHNLSDLGERFQFMQNDVILKQNQVNEPLYFVTDDTVRFEHANAGETKLLAKLGGASIFGEMSFLGKSKISASMIADSHGVVLNNSRRRSLKPDRQRHRIRVAFLPFGRGDLVAAPARHHQMRYYWYWNTHQFRPLQTPLIWRWS